VVPAVVMLGVLVDVVRVPSSLNLWPFELAMALLPGSGVAAGVTLPGSLLAHVMFTWDRGMTADPSPAGKPRLHGDGLYAA
jgi:hypothetical protein